MSRQSVAGGSRTDTIVHWRPRSHRAVIRFVLDELVKGNSRGRDKELDRSEKLEQRLDGVQLRFAQDSASAVATRIFRVGGARSGRPRDLS
jgi:hypothetical protein